MIDNRPFHYAIIASIGLHALTLLLFPDLLDPSRRGVQFPPPIIARLMEREPVPPPAAPEPPAEKPAAAVPREAPPKKKPQVAKPLPPPAVEPVPQFEPFIAQETAPAVEAPPAATAAIEPRPAPPAPEPAQPSESLSRDQYRLQLIDEARRHKRYPPLARENNWQGDVRVAVLVGANGRASVTLKASSGYEVLDRQALDMFRQAARTVTVPPALRGKAFALDVRAVYGLED